MGYIEGLATTRTNGMLTTELRDLLARLHPAPLGELEDLCREAGRAVDADLLTLCTACIETALDDEVWRPARALTDREQAYIDFTGQFVSSVSTMADEQVERLGEFASADEIYNFVCALYVADMTSRLNRVMSGVLA